MKTNVSISILIIIAIVLIIYPFTFSYKWIYLINLIVYSVMGYFINQAGSAYSLLENPRGQTQNSRLQLFIWSIIIMALLSSSLAYNLHTGDCTKSALVIEIPSSLWILLGVSGVTLAGELSIPESLTKKTGLLFTYPSLEDKSGSKNGEFNVERLQFILFLLITVSSYLSQSFYSFDQLSYQECISKLPDIHHTLAILSAVSSGTYLAVNASKKES